MAKFNLYQELRISLPGKSYPILIGTNALADKEVLRHYVSSKQVFIVTNNVVAPLYLHYLQAAFQDRQCNHLILEDGEAFKNEKSLFTIYDKLIAHHHHRDTTLVALGGGVIGDITGFAAATYQRGVSILQIPTTVLAQVDASIGGKTAINHPQAKNMIGCFHQPDAILIDLFTLRSLPAREFRAGLAEVIKYALLEGKEFFELVYSALEKGLADQTFENLAEIISQCCQIKAKIVQNDERERGQRALLNLGHTFAHALEAYSLYGRWLHGEAVAIGLYCAALLSYQKHQLNKKFIDLLIKMLKLAKLPHRIPMDVDLDRLCLLMSQDKKIKENQLRFILMKAVGNCYIENQVTKEQLNLCLKTAQEST